LLVGVVLLLLEGLKDAHHGHGAPLAGSIHCLHRKPTTGGTSHEAAIQFHTPTSLPPTTSTPGDTSSKLVSSPRYRTNKCSFCWCFLLQLTYMQAACVEGERQTDAPSLAYLKQRPGEWCKHPPRLLPTSLSEVPGIIQTPTTQTLSCLPPSIKSQVSYKTPAPSLACLPLSRPRCCTNRHTLCCLPAFLKSHPNSGWTSCRGCCQGSCQGCFIKAAR
jgi:hypothetical protein